MLQSCSGEKPLVNLPSEIAGQLSEACRVIELHLGPILHAIHLYGSALDGGLKPHSDIDLLVTLSARLDEVVRPHLLRELLASSAPPGQDSSLRALEVTVVALGEVVPWRYLARREMQFGEWLRKDIQAGVCDQATTDIDLTILLKKVRMSSIAVIGPAAKELFDPIPEEDFLRALADTQEQWRVPSDWQGDERNIVLTLARIWYSVETGKIASKEAAASWALERLPAKHRPILERARQAYLSGEDNDLSVPGGQVGAFVTYVKSAIATKRR